MAATLAGAKRPFRTMSLEHVMDGPALDANLGPSLQPISSSTSSDGCDHSSKRPRQAPASSSRGMIALFYLRCFFLDMAILRLS
jgi:hypothetical protein